MILVLAATAVAGLYMAWTIGANDVANAMGTSVGSGALTLRSALILAAVFELLGALVFSGTVTETISGGIVHPSVAASDPSTTAIGMTSCLIAASVWLHLATYLGWPVSTTHSIVGAVLGFGLWSGGTATVNWEVLARIAASWIVSPALGALIGFLVFKLIRRRILDTADPARAAARLGPWLTFPILATLALATMFKGLGPLELELGPEVWVPVSLGAGLVGFLGARHFLSRVRDAGGEDRTEKLFLVLQIFTAALMAFAHGSNDVSNAVGPTAAVFVAVREGLGESFEVPTNVLLIGAFGIVLGLATYGYRVMATIGREITQLTPSRGFSAEFGAAVTIVLASQLGLPVSTTHTLVGAVVGVGFARSIGALNLRVIRGIALSWLVTVPFTAVLAALLTALGHALLPR